MKPETKRTAAARRRSNDDGGSSLLNLSSLKDAIDDVTSPFNLSSLNRAIETIDDAPKETTTLDLSALSSSIHKVKQTEKSQRKKARENRKKKKKMMIGVKPEADDELRRWYSNFKDSFLKKKINLDCKVTPKEPQVCEFNTDHFSEACSLLNF